MQGYAIVGVALERISGMSYEDLVRVRLFEPLELRSAGLGAPASAGKGPQPWGHAVVADSEADTGSDSRVSLRAVPPGRGDDNPPAIAPAGTVHMNVHDFARYAHWHACEGAATPALLTHEQMLRLHRPPRAQDSTRPRGVWCSGAGRTARHDTQRLQHNELCGDVGGARAAVRCGCGV